MKKYQPSTQNSSHKRIIPKKSLGQNFLTSPHVKNKIIAACELKSTDTILEIGPGQGALTKLIAPDVAQVIAIEKDHSLAMQLHEEYRDTNVQIINDDILDYPFESLPKNLKVIGNLPYNVATPIIEKSLHHRAHFSSFYMTVQLEHGQRMNAKPHNKDYGSLSCFVQYYADVKMLFRIPPTAFYPAPNVQSCFMKMSFPDSLRLKAKDEEFLFKIIRQAFQQRRKNVLNALSTNIEREDLLILLEKLQINPQLRPENLGLKDYIALSDLMLETS